MNDSRHMLPRGPKGVWRQVCESLEITEGPGHVMTNVEGGQVRLLSDEMPKISAFWQRALARRLLRVGQQKHPNLAGVVKADLNASLKLLKGPSKLPRAELIQILTDAIWTQKIRAKMQPEASPVCLFCEQEDETPEHIFLRCPRWAPQRKWSPMVQAEWSESSAACRNCLYVDPDATNMLRKEWGQVQAQCAQILRLRQESYSLRKNPDEGRHVQSVPVCAPEKTARPFPFTLDYTLRTRGHPWLYDRQQWHQLTHYASKLQIPEEGCNVRCVSTCEFFLSFLLMNGMHRFCDSVPSQERGGLITTQVESFVRAWRSFESVSGSPSVLQEEGTNTAKCTWVSRYGLKGFPTLATPIVLPNAAAVQAFLADTAGEREHLRDSMPYETYGWWKLWAPGIPDSQMRTSGTLPMYPLANQAPKRLRGKTSPSWRSQQHEFRALWRRLSDCPIMNEQVGGRPMRDYVWEYGILSRDDLRSMSLAYRKRAERAQALITLNQNACKKRHHVAHTTLTVRAECLRCGRIGWLSHRSAWYTGRCGGVGPYVTHDANTSLAMQAESARQIADKLTGLKHWMPLV